MEKIVWTDRVRSEEVLQTVKDERNIPQTIKRRKANWIGHTLRRNCLLNQVIKGKTKIIMEMRVIRERRCKKLLDDHKGKRG
jgi:hypothetical protein